MLVLSSLFETHLAMMCASAPFVRPVFRVLMTRVGEFVNSMRFMKGKRLYATKPLNNPSGSSPKRSRKSFLSIAASLVQDEEKQAQRSNIDGITVAYQPSPSSYPRKSNTKPPPLNLQSSEKTERGHSQSEVSSPSIAGGLRWDGLRAPNADILCAPSPRSKGNRTDKSNIGTPESPLKVKNTPRSLGESTIDLNEVPDVPPLRDTRYFEPALSLGYVACRGCGQHHKHGHSHDYDAGRSPTSPKPARLGSGTWYLGKARRESQSTFFVDDDDDLV